MARNLIDEDLVEELKDIEAAQNVRHICLILNGRNDRAFRFAKQRSDLKSKESYIEAIKELSEAATEANNFVQELKNSSDNGTPLSKSLAPFKSLKQALVAIDDEIKASGSDFETALEEGLDALEDEMPLESLKAVGKVYDPVLVRALNDKKGGKSGGNSTSISGGTVNGDVGAQTTVRGNADMRKNYGKHIENNGGNYVGENQFGHIGGSINVGNNNSTRSGNNPNN